MVLLSEMTVAPATPRELTRATYSDLTSPPALLATPRSEKVYGVGLRRLSNEDGSSQLSPEVSTRMLAAAVLGSDSDLVRELIDSGRADPNAIDSNGLTPLHLACFTPDAPSSQATVLKLLKAGADVNALSHTVSRSRADARRSIELPQ